MHQIEPACSARSICDYENRNNDTSRSLQRNRNDATDGQCYPDTSRLPSRSGQIRCQKGAESVLHIGEKEVRRFEGMNTLFLAGINIHKR